MTNAQMKAELERLQLENESLKKQGVKKLSMKVSAKGGVSVYGLGRFPVTLYQTQWVRLLDIGPALREFMTANADSLTTKDSTQAASVQTKQAMDDDDLSPAEYRKIVASLRADQA